MVKNEGPKSLYLGLTPALTRSVVYGGLRLGLYEPSKYACDLAFGSSNVLVKIASGMFAGAISTALTNPMEVLKVSCHIFSYYFKYYFFVVSFKIIFPQSGAFANERRHEKEWTNFRASEDCI